MTKKQMRKLQRLISQHTEARINLAFKGCTPPENWAYYEEEAKNAREEMNKFLREICIDET